MRETQGAEAVVQRARLLLLAFLVGACGVLVAITVLSYHRLPQGLIASDGKGYYAWLRTIAMDRDLDFRNDFELIYPPDPVPRGPVTSAGRLANKYSVGLAIVEIPGFVAGHITATLTGRPANGVSAPYQVAVTVWLQLLLILGLAFLWAALVRLGAHPTVAMLGTASVLTATNLLHYAIRPAMAHAAGLAILCVALYLAVRVRSSVPDVRAFVALGILLGLATIVRPTNLALAPFFLVILGDRLRRTSIREGLAFALPFAAVVGIQVLLMSLLWDRLTFQGYAGEGFTSGLAGIANTLLSARHGLFVYHPWYLLALLLTLLAAASRRTRSVALGGLASFGMLAVANGTWWSWWFGDGFGNRAFIEIIPALLVPAVLWVSGSSPRTRWSIATGGVALTIVNVVLWTGYVLRRFPPDGLHSVGDAYLWWWR